MRYFTLVNFINLKPFVALNDLANLPTVKATLVATDTIVSTKSSLIIVLGEGQTME